MSALRAVHIVALALAVSIAAEPAGAAPAPGTRAPEWHRPDVAHARPTSAPARIVSLAPVVTETLFLLGAGSRIVGVTRFCDRPTDAAAITKVGGFVDISLEKVLALAPDLVIAMPSLGQRALLDRLRDAGVPVLVVFADSFAEAKLLTSGIGDVVDARAAAAKANAGVDEAVSALRARKLPALRAAVVVGHDPLVVAGPGTFAAEALAIAGLASAVPATAPMWPTWSAETLGTSRVELLVAAEGPAAADALRALVARVVPEGRRPRVVASSTAILMRPGPALVEDLAVLGRILAPSVEGAAPSAPSTPVSPR